MSFLRVSSTVHSGEDTVRVRAVIPARQITSILFLVASSFLALHLIAYYLFYHAPIDSSLFRLIVEALDLNAEGTLSTWYSSVTLLACGIGFGFVALAAYQDGSPRALHWSALCLLAMLFSADEIAGLHEKLNGPVKMLIHAGGFFTFAWVIPGLVFVLFLLVSFRRFYRSLPRQTRFYLGLATALYFLGSLGLEMVGGEYSEAYGRDGFGYKALTGLEEFLEMAGVATFLHGIAVHINAHVSWSIPRQLREEPAPVASEPRDLVRSIAVVQRSPHG
ncbi:MAG: hypothetical protein EHM18_05315 [Acidobacteria bacterium]|nr:MAG: hypothetical protein EHM18_05315 [Acidobacteriota bacterium]